MGKQRLNLAFSDKNAAHQKVYRALVSQGRHKTDFVCRAVLQYLGDGGELNEDKLTTAIEGVLKNLLSRYEFRPRDNIQIEEAREDISSGIPAEADEINSDIAEEDKELIRQMLEYSKTFG